MILYTENLKESTHKSTIIVKFSKLSRYKINIQKSVAFLYINNEIPESKSKKKKNLFLKITSKNKILKNKPYQRGEGFTC